MQLLCLHACVCGLPGSVLKGLLGRLHFTALAPSLVSVVLLGSCILRVFFPNPFGTARGACVGKILPLGEVLAACFSLQGEASVSPTSCIYWAVGHS